MDPKIHSIAKYHNGIILVVLYLLGGESGSGKSRVLLWDWFINLGETTKDNLFICDGKGEELYNVGKYILGFFTKCW